MRIAYLALAACLLGLSFAPGVAATKTVCVPPGALNGACVGTADGEECAWYWLGPNNTRVCSDGLGAEVCSNHLFGSEWRCVNPGDLVTPAPICGPPGTGNYGCAGIVDGSVCAWTSGAARHTACVGREGAWVCSNQLFRPILGDGTHCAGELLN